MVRRACRERYCRAEQEKIKILDGPRLLVVA